MVKHAHQSFIPQAKGVSKQGLASSEALGYKMGGSEERALAMAALVKFNTFSRDCLQGIHDFSSHSFKAMLTSVAPVAGNSVKGDLTEIGAGNGYVAGGSAVTMALSLTGGTAKVVATDRTFTASGGSIGPFRYVVLYNDTSTGDRLIGYLDYGAAITLADGETFTADFDGTAGLLTLA